MMDYARLQKDRTYGTISNPHSGSVCVVNLNTTFRPLDQKAGPASTELRNESPALYRRRARRRGQRAGTALVGGVPGVSGGQESTFAYDLDKARSLLRQAGVTSLTLDFVYFPGNPSEGLAEIYQADLATLGITLNIMPVDPLAWRDLNQIGA